MTEEMKQYLIERNGLPSLKIAVPATWKVTFGPVVIPNSGPKTYGQLPAYALRFYESETKQRAIFTNVTSFRDLSIEIFESKTAWKKAMDGKTDEDYKEWVKVE